MEDKVKAIMEFSYIDMFDELEEVFEDSDDIDMEEIDQLYDEDDMEAPDLDDTAFLYD